MTVTEDSRHLMELRSTPYGGHGFYAKEPIPAGTLVLSEEPFLTIKSEPFYTHGPFSIIRAFDTLPESLKTTYLSLHACLDERVLYVHHEYWNSLSPEEQKIVAIWHTNCWEQLNTQTHFDDGLSLFALCSRFNHSCVPNTVKVRNEVRTCRDVQQDEELCIDYIYSYMMLSEARKADTVRGWGFVCQCVACADETGESDRRRQRIGTLCLIIHNFPHHRDKTQSLRACEEYDELMQEEGLFPEHVRSVYAQAVRFCWKLRDAEGMLKWARKFVNNAKICCGSSSQFSWAEDLIHWLEKGHLLDPEHLKDVDEGTVCWV